MMFGRMASNSKLPWPPAIAIASSSPITWIAIITIDSDWVGLTLPGMTDEAASFCGSLSFPSTARSSRDRLQLGQPSVFRQPVVEALADDLQGNQDGGRYAR